MSELKEVFDMVTKQKEPDQDSWQQQQERQRRTSRNRRWSAVALVAAMAAAATVFVLSRPSEKNTAANNPPASVVPFNTVPPFGPQIIGLDGTPIQQFAATPAGANDLALSPDGTTIAYMSGGQVRSVGADGAHRQTLTTGSTTIHGGGWFHLSWSPDGSKIAYAWNGEIEVMNADGSDKQQLTHSPAGQGSYYPSWSADGSRILYWSGANSGQDGGPADAEIYTIAATGGTPSRLTHDSLSDFEPTWSPDGTQIAYWHGGELWAMRADGSQAHLVHHGQGGTWAPAWSPDGTMIAFLVYDPNERSVNDAPLLFVRIVTLSTGTVSRLPVRVETDYNGPSWTPTGVLFVNRYD